MNKTHILFLLALGATVVRAFALPADEPILQLRLRMPDVRSDEQGPLTLRLRHVPAGGKSMVWREMNRAPVTLPLVRDGDVARVTVPSVSAWNAGWLELPCGK